LREQVAGHPLADKRSGPGGAQPARATRTEVNHMTTQIEKQQKRWASFSGRLISRICSAENYGLIDEAGALECKYGIIEDAWLKSSVTAKSRLYRYFGAPEDSVDLQKELNNTSYRRHLNSPHVSATPPPLRRYIEARNDRVRKFEVWIPWGNHPDAMAKIVKHVVRRYPASGRGANRALNQAMVARRNEIQALSEAIERCYVLVLRTTRSAPEFGQGLLSDLSIIPWQLGHVYLLRDIAINDIEITAEQREQLRKVIMFLRTQQS